MEKWLTEQGTYLQKRHQVRERKGSERLSMLAYDIYSHREEPFLFFFPFATGEIHPLNIM